VRKSDLRGVFNMLFRMVIMTGRVAFNHIVSVDCANVTQITRAHEELSGLSREVGAVALPIWPSESHAKSTNYRKTPLTDAR
jgi:hypothetical protein